MNEAILKTVIDILQPCFAGTLIEITPESTFEELEIDSLDKIEMLLGIEQKFKRSIPDEDYDLITSVEQLVNYLDERVG